MSFRAAGLQSFAFDVGMSIDWGGCVRLAGWATVTWLVRQRNVAFVKLLALYEHGNAMWKVGGAMKRYKFKAKIEAGMGGGAFVFFPYDAEKEFATKGKVAVKATLDGVPYAGSLMACGGPHHMLGVLKAIREKTGKGVGDVVEVEVWKDDAERVVEVPAKFKELMKK